MINKIIDFIHDTKFSDLSKNTQEITTLCILDLIGVGIAGATTELSKIIRNLTDYLLQSPLTTN